MTDLKPCKFCGMSGHGLYVTSNAHDAPFVECNDCGACGPVESTEAEAIASWNRSGWQPIETAPKDGTEFQAWFINPAGYGFWEPRCRFNEHGTLGIYGRIDWDTEGFDYEISHLEFTNWMPLPEPPQ